MKAMPVIIDNSGYVELLTVDFVNYLYKTGHKIDLSLFEEQLQKEASNAKN